MSITRTMNLEPKTTENADAISSQILETTQKKLGLIPNMYTGMANNTALLDGYVSAYSSFRANSGFNPQEQEVVFLSIAFENDCEYCMAAHSFVGDKMTNVPIEVTNAIRNNTEIPNEKLKALSTFSRAITSKRGLPTDVDIDNFINAGYTEKNILGVIAGVGIKTMSNYFNHIFNTPVDEAFKSRVWKKK
ncbi:carboxymuconolactone decarboxylase family protein [uncultured Aquimarina sp.]|uniref:carboxymuconolactone decarboxylase family protein n=1 Tax=uncultured Aquimarina sp. TaxID=575652 RepID=UPI0026053A8F|nr:carboxymuconolactone decarboxylase family protein [uncultured Aquimarina sp.]